MQEVQVWSLDQEDPLDEEMAIHSSILVWEIPWTEYEPGGLQSVGSQRARHDLATEHIMKGMFYLIKRKSYNFKTMQVKRGMWSVKSYSINSIFLFGFQSAFKHSSWFTCVWGNVIPTFKWGKQVSRRQMAYLKISQSLSIKNQNSNLGLLI